MSGITKTFQSSALKKFQERLIGQINELKEAGTYKAERIISSAQSDKIKLLNRPDEFMNFCANNYLGLAVN